MLNQQTLKKSLPEKSILKQAWVIQLGSFRHKKNVEGAYPQVCIGPELIKSSLEKKIAGLKKLTNVQGKLARFYPTK